MTKRRKVQRPAKPTFQPERVYEHVRDAEDQYRDGMSDRNLHTRWIWLEDATWNLIEARDCINHAIMAIDEQVAVIRAKIKTAKGGKK